MVFHFSLFWNRRGGYNVNEFFNKFVGRRSLAFYTIAISDNIEFSVFAHLCD